MQYLYNSASKKYISDNPVTLEDLKKIFPYIERYFGKDAKVMLKMAYAEDESWLAAHVQTTTGMSRAKEARKKLHDLWYKKESCNLPLTLNLEYV